MASFISKKAIMEALDLKGVMFNPDKTKVELQELLDKVDGTEVQSTPIVDVPDREPPIVPSNEPEPPVRYSTQFSQNEQVSVSKRGLYELLFALSQGSPQGIRMVTRTATASVVMKLFGITDFNGARTKVGEIHHTIYKWNH